MVFSFCTLNNQNRVGVNHTPTLHEDIQNDEESISKDLGTLDSQQKFLLSNLFFKNSSIKSFDDDKRRISSLSKEEELLISTLREELNGDFIDRSFNAVVRKVVDKHKQGKVTSFREYLVTSLIGKVEVLELRRIKIRLKLRSSEIK